MKPGTLYALPDHGKKANGKTFKKIFLDALSPEQQGNLDVTHFELHFEEASLRQRRRATRSKLMEQTEKLFIFVDTLLTLPDRKRKHYPGSNRGQSWGFLVMEPVESLWHVQWQTKQAAYGKEAIRPVGGKADEGDTEIVDDVVEDKAIKPTTLVPMVWHGLPKLFYTELLQVNNCLGIIDFTPGDGNMALAALHHRGSTGGIVYCGWCHTEQHAQLLREYLGQQVLQSMRQEGSSLYDVQCAAAFAEDKAPQKKRKVNVGDPNKGPKKRKGIDENKETKENKDKENKDKENKDKENKDKVPKEPFSSPPPSPSESE
jgi:hypothetical protein